MIAKLAEREIGSPPFPDFPRSEYEARLRRVRALMRERHVDLLVLWDLENVRYFSGFHQTPPNVNSLPWAVYLIPSDGDPALIIPELFRFTFEGHCYQERAWLFMDPHITSNLRQFPLDLADLVKQFGYENGAIGTETGWLGGMATNRPFNDIVTFRAALPGAEFIDAADLIWQCRMIKSSAEVEFIRRACDACVRAYGVLGSEFKLGMGEREVGIRYWQAVLENADECSAPCIVSSSRLAGRMADTGPHYPSVHLARGDRVGFEALPTHKGYYGSCCRVFQIGSIPKEILRKAEAVDLAQAEAMKAIRPGVRSGVITDVITEVLASEGLGNPGDAQASHGVGLGIHEPPMIARSEEGIIEEGMVLAAQVGGIGIAPGANINFEVGHAVFEATHGTAPKYTNQDVVNPGSVILSGEMMLRYLGWKEAADLIIRGMEGAIAGRTVTYDFHRLTEGARLVKCSEFGDHVIRNMG